MDDLRIYLALFQEEYGNYPTQANWENELVDFIRKIEPDTTSHLWKDGFYDAWGNRFVYSFDPKDPFVYHLYSKGRDGESRSAGMDKDDIGNREDDGRTYKYYHPGLLRNPYFVSIALMLFLSVLLSVISVYKKPYKRNWEKECGDG